jgi:ribonuclease HI
MVKLSWGIKHAAIETIYKGAILPLLTYGAPVWIDARKYENRRQKYIRVQRLINIRMAKAYRTTSSEALCILTGMTFINIKLKEVVKRYNINKRTRNHTFELHSDVELKHWLHTADAVAIKEVAGNEKASVHAYTDGSKHGQRVGSGAAIFIGNEIMAQIKSKLDIRCSYNQADQLATVNALEAIESLQNKLIRPCTVTIFADSRVVLDSLRNVNHTYLVEEIGKRVARLESYEWKVTLSWVKDHVGTYGNELADRIAKEAARSKGTSIAFNRISVRILYYGAAEEVRPKLQDEWTTCTKAATKISTFRPYMTDLG